MMTKEKEIEPIVLLAYEREHEALQRKCTDEKFLAEVSQLIRTEYPGYIGTLSLRYLFSLEGIHRFRMNWWRDNMIIFSVFARIAENGDSTLKLVGSNSE